ncbi:MAG: hypothetical protein MK160_06700 [Rhodobacteraceae bacterium]|nr:hypothetical protein [Paracoccaceae bacterium]
MDKAPVPFVQRSSLEHDVVGRVAKSNTQIGKGDALKQDRIVAFVELGRPVVAGQVIGNQIVEVSDLGEFGKIDAWTLRAL